MDETRERRWNFWHWLRVAVLIYLAPLVVMALDVQFFKSRIQQMVGREVESVFENIYWPVIVLLNHFFKLFD